MIYDKVTGGGTIGSFISENVEIIITLSQLLHLISLEKERELKSSNTNTKPFSYCSVPLFSLRVLLMWLTAVV